MKPLDMWQGEFGDAYTRRNVVDWQVRYNAWRTMLDGLLPQSILEVGCNRGANLRAIEESVLQSVIVRGVEPNAIARASAALTVLRAKIIDGTASRIPETASWDLVFTAGVLIHIPPEELEVALRELYRVSRRWLLSIEYWAPAPMEVEYRGLNNMLWKRNWPIEWLTRFPDLRLIRSGDWRQADGFDDCGWWLFEKRQGEHEKDGSAHPGSAHQQQTPWQDPETNWSVAGARSYI